MAIPHWHPALAMSGGSLLDGLAFKTAAWSGTGDGSVWRAEGERTEL
jgi:hypothetical protein